MIRDNDGEDAPAVAVEGPPEPETSGEAAGREPIGGWPIFVYSLAYFSFMLLTLMPGLFSLAYKTSLIAPDTKEAALGVVVSVGGLAGLVLAPLVGVFSDRTRTRWGRRRPYLVAAIPVMTGGALLIAAAQSVTALTAGWVVATVGTSLMGAAVMPAMAEWVPEAQRAKVGAFTGIGTQLAGVAATLLGSVLMADLWLLFLTPVALAAVVIAVYVKTVPDAPASEGLSLASVATVFKDLAYNPVRHLDFTMVWIGKFFMQFAMAFFSTYQLYFLVDRLGFTPADAGQRLALVGALGIFCTMGSAIVSGVLSDRWRRRKTFIYVAAGLVGGGLVVTAFAADIWMYAAGCLLLVSGAGVFGSVDLALAGDVLPDKEHKAGKFMAIYGIAGGAPTAVAPLVAPLVLAIGAGGANYTALFVTGAALTIVAALSAWRIRAVR